MGRAAELQPKIFPVPPLRRPWFSNRIICKDGWSLSFSGSTWRVDKYDYYEDGKHLVLGGEGTQQMDVFLTEKLKWDEPSDVVLDDQTRDRVLRNITVALQWAGFDVGFFMLEESK